MKFSALSFLAFTSSVAAWDGQVSQWNDATTGEGPGLSHIDLIDYGTGSTYSANTFYGWTISSSGTELGLVHICVKSYSEEMAYMITVSLKPALVVTTLTLLSGLPMMDVSTLTFRVPLVRAMDTAVATPVNLVPRYYDLDLMAAVTKLLFVILCVYLALVH